MRSGPFTGRRLGSGYLMVFGTMVALGKRAQEGRSWLVCISLAQVGKWILDLGEVAPAALQAIPAEFTREELALWSIGEQNAIWAITAPQPTVQLSETPAQWTRPSVPLGYLSRSGSRDDVPPGRAPAPV